MNKKFFIIVLLLVFGYFGFDYMVTARLGYLYLKCATPADREKIMDEKKSTVTDRLKVSSKIFMCVREKQGALEKLIIRVPENWINPPPVSN